MIPPKCLGIPVHYSERLRVICESRGIWRWKKIVVGPDFTQFPPREKMAFLLHEAGHCKLHHVEKRLLNLWWLLIWPRRLVRLCVEQEHQADLFVKNCGYGADLARAFSRLVEMEKTLHPPIKERIARLTNAPMDGG